MAPLSFAIVSWGAAATHWLAHALNSHPAIYCVHNGRAASNETPAQYLDSLQKKAAEAHAAGDVHGLTYADIDALGDRPRFSCAVVVREPIARLTSACALYRRKNYKGWGDLSWLRPTAEQAGYDFDALASDRRVILHGVHLLNSIIYEHRIGPVFRMEDLTSDPNYLLEIASYVTRGALRKESAWAEQTASGNPLNRHLKHAPADLDDWTREAVLRVVEPTAWDMYRELGYDAPSWAPPRTSGPRSDSEPFASYELDAFEAFDVATVEPTSEGVQIVTNAEAGAFSARLELGETATLNDALIRVTVRVDEGSFNVVSTQRAWPPDYNHYIVPVFDGETTTLELPVDQNGKPVLVIANGPENGRPSRGTVLSVSLV